MDVSSLSYLVGKEHEEEARAIIEQNEGLLHKISFRNPRVTLIL